jgi:hypothetical protein
MAYEWHDRGGCTRAGQGRGGRSPLERALQLRSEASGACLLDEALTALVARHRAAEIDACYLAAYKHHVLDEPDARGDLESWHGAASPS